MEEKLQSAAVASSSTSSPRVVEKQDTAWIQQVGLRFHSQQASASGHRLIRRCTLHTVVSDMSLNTPSASVELVYFWP